MYLYGAGGHAKVIIDILRSQNIAVAGLVDDNPAIDRLQGLPILREVPTDASVIVSIGLNHVRKRVVEKLRCTFGTAIHAHAVVSDTARLGEGSVVMAGAIINADARIGKHCIVNTGASVDHECTIADFVHLSPRATLCGNVSVGEGTWVGAGATVIPGVKIGRWCLIGAGAVVVRDLPDHSVAYGNPCRIHGQTPPAP